MKEPDRLALEIAINFHAMSLTMPRYIAIIVYTLTTLHKRPVTKRQMYKIIKQVRGSLTSEDKTYIRKIIAVILPSMEKKGYIEEKTVTYWKSNPRTTKVYTITEKGTKSLYKYIELFYKYSEFINLPVSKLGHTKYQEERVRIIKEMKYLFRDVVIKKFNQHR